MLQRPHHDPGLKAALGPPLWEVDIVLIRGNSEHAAVAAAIAQGIERHGGRIGPGMNQAVFLGGIDDGQGLKDIAPGPIQIGAIAAGVIQQFAAAVDSECRSKIGTAYRQGKATSRAISSIGGGTAPELGFEGFYFLGSLKLLLSHWLPGFQIIASYRDLEQPLAPGTFERAFVGGLDEEYLYLLAAPGTGYGCHTQTSCGM